MLSAPVSPDVTESSAWVTAAHTCPASSCAVHFVPRFASAPSIESVCTIAERTPVARRAIVGSCSTSTDWMFAMPPASSIIPTTLAAFAPDLRIAIPFLFASFACAFSPAVSSCEFAPARRDVLAHSAATVSYSIASTAQPLVWPSHLIASWRSAVPAVPVVTLTLTPGTPAMSSHTTAPVAWRGRGEEVHSAG